jgi:hypothetical protein
MRGLEGASAMNNAKAFRVVERCSLLLFAGVSATLSLWAQTQGLASDEHNTVDVQAKKWSTSPPKAEGGLAADSHSFSRKPGRTLGEHSECDRHHAAA